MTQNTTNGLPGLWDPEFKEKVKKGEIPRDSEDYTGWKVDLNWLKDQIDHHEKDPDRIPGEDYSYIVFIVTKQKPSEESETEEEVAWDSANERIIDPVKHRLWIRAFGSPESMAEDFPPINWP